MIKIPCEKMSETKINSGLFTLVMVGSVFLFSYLSVMSTICPFVTAVGVDVIVHRLVKPVKKSTVSHRRWNRITVYFSLDWSD